MVGGTMMAYLGGLHYWWPKMTGRMYPELWARLSALVIFLGFNLTFFPQFIMGYLGMPRRYHAYPEEFQVYHVLSTAGASVLAVGYLIPAVYLIWSLRYGNLAPDNRAQHNIEMVARVAECRRVQRAIHSVAAEHAAEKQNLRHQKDPHAKRGRVFLLLDVVELVAER